MGTRHVTKIEGCCAKCGHQWIIRRKNPPKICPKCKQTTWNADSDYFKPLPDDKTSNSKSQKEQEKADEPSKATADSEAKSKSDSETKKQKESEGGKKFPSEPQSNSSLTEESSGDKISLKSSPEPQNLNLTQENEESEEDINLDDYTYQCGECGAYFNNLKENCCPSCNEPLNAT